MVAHGMKLRKPPPRPDCLPPTGVKIWSEELGGSAAASSSSDGRPSWRVKQRRVVIGKDGEVVYTVGTIIKAVAAAWTLLLILFLLWWRPHIGLTGGATGAAFLVGILLSYVYFANLRSKEQYQQVVSDTAQHSTSVKH